MSRTTPSSSHLTLPRRAIACAVAVIYHAQFVLAKRRGGGGGFSLGSSGDSNSPSSFYQYEEGSTPSGTVGVWVPTKNSGPAYEDGCILWTHGQFSTSYWKPTCAEPYLKTIVYVGAVAVGFGVLLIGYILYLAWKKKRERERAIEAAVIATLMAMAEEEKAREAAEAQGQQQAAGADQGTTVVVDIDGNAPTPQPPQEPSEATIAPKPEQQSVPVAVPK